MIGCAGVGLHSGARVAVTFRPAAEGSGVRFRRVDRPGTGAIAAHPANVVATGEATALAGPAGIAVQGVERLAAALAICQIDNALVEVSGPELPAMDGSARPFVLLMECAGTAEQDLPAAELEVLRPVEVVAGPASARLEPAVELEIEAQPAAAPGPFRLTLSCERGRNELMAAPAGDARRAVLDALGTLALVPARIRGRYVERAAGPSLRCALIRALLTEAGNYRLLGAGPRAWAEPGPALARAG